MNFFGGQFFTGSFYGGFTSGPFFGGLFFSGGFFGATPVTAATQVFVEIRSFLERRGFC